MAAPAVFQANEVIEGRYTLKERVEDWGVGEAWTASDARFADRVVVVKFLPAGEESLTEVVLSRLERVRGLRHKHILPLVDHGVASGREFAVHEHGPLRSLGAWLDAKRAEGVLPPLDAVKSVFGHICEAVSAGHGEDPPIVHEGISPSAVLLRGGDEELRARVFDFGIAPFADPIRAPEGSARAVACVAPEQFQGEEPDARTDQFSLALLLLEMLAALPDPSAAGRYRGRGDVPEAVWQVIQRALHTARDERFPSVKDFASALLPAWEQPLPATQPAAQPSAPVAAMEAAQPVAPSAQPLPPQPTVRLYDDESVAARAPAIEVISAPAVFVPGASDTAPIGEQLLADLDLPEEIGARTVALPHGPAAQSMAARYAHPVDDPPPEERTAAMEAVAPDGLMESRTVSFDAAALFQDAAPDALSTMRANRDPRALMEMTRRYRQGAAAKAPSPPRKQTMAAPSPSFVKAPTRPEPPAPTPAAPAPKADAPARATPPATSEASRRMLTAVVSMLLAFAAVLGIVWAIFRARHR